MTLKTPVISVVLGEGGSGGALALAVCDELAMLEHALYSVISPRGFASILWKDPSREKEAADLMKITADDLYNFGVCDKIIAEPVGGAHTDPAQTAEMLHEMAVSGTAMALLVTAVWAVYVLISAKSKSRDTDTARSRAGA